MSKTPTKPVGFRLPTDLLERVQAYADRREAAEPGLEVSLTDAVRLLLEVGLRAPAVRGSMGETTTRPVAFRLPTDLLERVQAYADRRQVELSLTDAVRVLLDAGLRASAVRGRKSKP